jgi:hypothetical protein
VVFSSSGAGSLFQSKSSYRVRVFLAGDAGAGIKDVVLDDRPDSSKSTRVCWMRMSGRGWSSLLSSNTGIQSKLACALRFRLMVVVRRRMLEE